MPFRDGDFERTVLPHVRSLLRFAMRLDGDSVNAEDLVQETLLLAWRGFARFEPGTNPRAWLFQILLNVFRQQKRKANGFTAATLMDADRATQPSTHEALELMEALDGLGSEQRTVLLLAAVEGFTCSEISKITGAPIGTVMSRLSRARQTMRGLLSRVTP